MATRSEEDKLLYELRKILGLPELLVDATCVRVPVERCHSESVAVELERPLPVEEARALLASAPGLELVDDPAARRTRCRSCRPGATRSRWGGCGRGACSSTG
jgi:aspartate-semialdehyde dehydrogenase